MAVRDVPGSRPTPSDQQWRNLSTTRREKLMPGGRPSELREKTLPIGVCDRRAKHAVALSALGVCYVNILATDEATAFHVLEQADAD